MAVYYKFKSARDYDSIGMDGPFISVGILKEKIFESKHLGRGTDFDLVVTNAQTNEEYLDEAALIPKNTSVLIRRVPGRPRMPIVTDSEPRVEDVLQNIEPEKTSFMGAGSSMNPEPDWDDLGGDLYEIPEVQPVQPSYIVPNIPPSNEADEESKLKALIENPVLDWQQQGPEGFGPGRGFGRGMNGRMGGRGFGGRTGGFEKKTPPQGYICHRCKVPGHFIQHCPTNGDPNFDIKRVKAPTGIPRSMLQATPEGSYALPSGAVAVLRPNEAAFEKEIEGLPSTRSVGDLPPELHCPLCKEVMKDAVLTSKCCFKSFCDKCIRNYITSKAVCVCGDTNTLADDLLPNKTLRDAINRILESGGNSNDNPGSAFQVQDMESARLPPKIPSPTLSAASKGENKPSPLAEALKTQEIVDERKPVASQQMLESVRNTKIADASEATHDSMSVKEPASQGSAPLVNEEVQQRLATVEAGKKRKKKKVRMPANDMQWKSPQDLAAENYMMHMGPNAYNPYWNGMQPGMGMDGFMPPYGAPMPYMGYGMGPMDMPFGGPFPPDSFGGQGYMTPMPPPQRDLADFGMGMGMNGMNVGPPIMSREEFEARKADLRRKRENERRDQSRDFSKDRDYGREIGGNNDLPPMKSKSKSSSLVRSPSPDYRDRDHHQRHHRYDRSSPEPPPLRDHRDRRASRDLVDHLPPPRPPKRKSDHHDREQEPQRESTKDYDYYNEDKPRQKRHRSESSSSKPDANTETSAPQSKPSSSAKVAAEAASAKSKASVFSRISFPAGEANKKKSSPPEAVVGGGSKEPVANGFHDHEYSRSSKAAAAAAAASVSTSSRKTGVSSPAAVEYESASDEDRHFKRKKKSLSSRYVPEASPKEVEVEEEPRQHSRGSRDRELEHRRPR